MMIPDSAIVPSIATKPNGLPKASSASVTPISPSGAVSTTISVRAKLPAAPSAASAPDQTNSGTPAAIDRWPCGESSIAPPISIR